MIAKAARSLPPQMPVPPSYQKVNPGDQPVIFLVLHSPTLPLSVINEYAETTIAQRLSMVSGVAQVQVFGAAKYAVRIDVDPRQLAAKGIGIDEVADVGRERQRHAADRHDVRIAADLHGARQRPVVQRRCLRADDRRLSQRQPRPARRSGARLRRHRERQERGVVRHRAHGLPRRAETARHQRRRGRRRRQGAAAVVPRTAARGARTRQPVGSVGGHPRIGPRRQVHAAPHGGARRPGDLPLPEESVGDDHSQPGAAGLGRRDVCRHVPARLQPRQPVAHGAHARGRLRRRRCHRDAREHRPAHGDGQAADAGGLRRLDGKSPSRFCR